jgi:hypothetical protein
MSIRRRLQRLETEFRVAHPPQYPPLTGTEIAEIEARVRADRPLTAVQIHRLERQSPVIDGELMITCHQGSVFLKRYIGVDLALL